jgi:hypothetical protein
MANGLDSDPQEIDLRAAAVLACSACGSGSLWYTIAFPGGQLEIAAKPGKGTRFAVFVPKRRA